MELRVAVEGRVLVSDGHLGCERGGETLVGFGEIFGIQLVQSGRPNRERHWGSGWEPPGKNAMSPRCSRR